MKTYYTCGEVANLYRVKIATVWSWIRTGKLKAIRAGKQYRIPKDAFAEFEKQMHN